MRRPVQYFLAFSLLILLLLSAVSCGHKIAEEDAQKTAEDFVLAIAESRYDDAASLMHPVCETSGGDIRQYFEATISSYGVKSLSDFRIESVTDTKLVDNDDLYEGAYCSLTTIASADGKTFEFRVEIVKNDLGYGIHNFHFDFGTK